MAKSQKTGRIRQLGQAYQFTKRTDKRIGLVLLGAFAFSFAVGLALFFLLPPGWLILDVLSAVLVGILGTLIVFSRRVSRSHIKQIEGQPGAAASVLSLLRRGWRVDQAIAFNRQQDIIHRVVGPPGIVLVAEGNPHRLKSLMAGERTKHQRVVADTPVHEIIVGDGEGEVPLGKLQRQVSKMKREVQPSEMTDILARLRALDASRPALPLPKGPMPTSMKGMRSQMRGQSRGR